MIRRRTWTNTVQAARIARMHQCIDASLPGQPPLPQHRGEDPMAALDMDRGWRFDTRQLFPQWDSVRQRFGYMHPERPSVQAALGYATVFMGWTLADAEACCHTSNDRLATQEACCHTIDMLPVVNDEDAGTNPFLFPSDEAPQA